MFSEAGRGREEETALPSGIYAEHAPHADTALSLTRRPLRSQLGSHGHTASAGGRAGI